MIPPTPTGPPDGGTVTAANPTTFTWNYQGFNPPAQTSADFQYRVYGTSTWTVLTGVVTTALQYTVAGGTFTGSSFYEWQVRGHSSGATSAWSGSWFFYAGAPVSAPTITAPVSGSAQPTSPVTVTWTLPSGTTQSAYEVRRCSDSAGSVIYYDSGPVTSSAQTAQVPLDPVTRTDHIQVSFLYGGVWSSWADITISTGLQPPMPALLTATANPATASVTVQIINPAPTTGFSAAIANDLYRMSPDGTQVRIASQLAPNAYFIDWYPGAGVNTYSVNPFTAAGVVAASTLDHLSVEAGTLDALGVLYPTLAAVL